MCGAFQLRWQEECRKGPMVCNPHGSITLMSATLGKTSDTKTFIPVLPQVQGWYDQDIPAASWRNGSWSHRICCTEPEYPHLRTPTEIGETFSSNESSHVCLWGTISFLIGTHYPIQSYLPQMWHNSMQTWISTGYTSGTVYLRMTESKDTLLRSLRTEPTSVLSLNPENCKVR